MNNLLIISENWAHSLAWTLIHFIWQGAILGTCLFMGLKTLRNSSPQLRYMCCCATLLLMCVFPAITFFSGIHPNVSTADFPSTVGTTVSTVKQGLIGAKINCFSLTVFIWQCGVMFFVLRTGFLWFGTLRLRKIGLSKFDIDVTTSLKLICKELGIRKKIKLLKSTQITGPVTLGWLKPVILIPPATLAGLTPEQFEAVLVHELTHIRRHDYAVNLVQCLIEALFFYHPAVWWVSKMARNEREHCCDDVAATYTKQPLEYAKALMALEELRSRPSLAMAAGGTGGLLSRINRLLNTKQIERSQPMLRSTSIIALLLVVSGVLSACINTETHPTPNMSKILIDTDMTIASNWTIKNDLVIKDSEVKIKDGVKFTVSRLIIKGQVTLVGNGQLIIKDAIFVDSEATLNLEKFGQNSLQQK